MGPLNKRGGLAWRSATTWSAVSTMPGATRVPVPRLMLLLSCMTSIRQIAPRMLRFRVSPSSREGGKNNRRAVGEQLGGLETLVGCSWKLCCGTGNDKQTFAAHGFCPQMMEP